VERKHTISVCLNPHEHHSIAETIHDSLLCPDPHCGFLVQGGNVEHWRVTTLLGQGPIADLYLASSAQRIASGYSRVLVKVLRTLAPGPVSRLQRLLALRHPHIHPLLQIGWVDQSRKLYLLSPYEEKGSLARSLETGDLQLQDIASIVLQIAEALQYAHEQQIVHGRLKPENCLLVAPATVQVCDFYRPFWPEQLRAGSSPFTAPEQLYGQTVPASDQYALAMIAYMLLNKQHSFARSQSGALMISQLQSTQPLTGDQQTRLPDLLYAVLKRALSKQSGERFRDISTFAAAFQAALTDISTPADLQLSPARPFPLSPVRLRISAPLSQQESGSHARISAPLPRQEFTSPPGKVTPVCSLPGHTSIINRLQWANNGIYLASTSDADIRLWRIQRRIGTLQTTLSGHTDKVLALSWSPDSSLLASSGTDTTIRIWHISDLSGSASFRQTAWRGHEGGVLALDWSPDGMCLASGGKDRMLRVWDPKGNPVRAWQAHGRGGIGALAWSPRDPLLASGGIDHLIHIWDSSTGDPLLTCKAHNDEIRHLAWSPDGKMLASSAGKKDRQVCLWDPYTGQLRAALSGHSREIVGLSWSADTEWLATASADGTLRIWNISPTPGKQSERPIFIAQGIPLAMAAAPATDLVAVGLNNLLIQIFQFGN
jgi:serine/threonine protein kinase